MAGTFVSIDVIGQQDIAKALNKLIANADNIAPAQREIGEYLLESTQDRMAEQTAPDGSEWEPLSPKTVTAKRKKNQSPKILRAEGTLADTLNYQLNGDQLLFGTDKEYAASMQFGRESANIPAREFLGLSTDDETEILHILQSHLMSA